MHLSYEEYARLREARTSYLPIEKGGEGSGNFGHEGRPGQVGGSLPGDDGDEDEDWDMWDASNAKDGQFVVPNTERGISAQDVLLHGLASLVGWKAGKAAGSMGLALGTKSSDRLIRAVNSLGRRNPLAYALTLGAARLGGGALGVAAANKLLSYLRNKGVKSIEDLEHLSGQTANDAPGE